MSGADHTVFVCQNVRPPGHREGCCHARGGPEVLAAFRTAVDDAGLGGRVAVRPSGCLDACPRGPVAVVYAGDLAKPPGSLARMWKSGTWYGGLVPRDVPLIVARHLGAGAPDDPALARLRF